MNNLQENKIKRSINWSHNTIESCYKSVVLKGWFMPPRVKLGANGSWWSQKWLSVDNLMGAYDEVTFPAKVREKDTRVTLANCSLMIKSVEFPISLKE